MLLTIHQPEHMPWLGFFHKLAQADACVILDNVQFRKNYFQNRNKVRTIEEWSWIAVPVNYTIHTMIQDVTIARDPRWKRKWWRTIEYAYNKAPYSHLYLDGLHSLIDEDWEKLTDLNVALINLLCKYLGITTRLFLGSSLKVNGKGSDLIRNMCEVLKAKTYLSGISGQEYLNLSDFVSSGIEVVFQQFHHPVYSQMYQPFIPCMSVIDLLCNHGPKSLEILNGVGVPVMDDLFL